MLGALPKEAEAQSKHRELLLDIPDPMQSAHAHPEYLQPLRQQGEYSFAHTESLNVFNPECSLGPLVVILESTPIFFYFFFCFIICF